MRVKDDDMRNGQLATEGQYAFAYDLFPNPTDTRTLIPFLRTIEDKDFPLPTYIVGDAGYGSEPNYDEIIQKDRIPLITYNHYRREKTKKYKENQFHYSNWDYIEETDTFTCPNGRKIAYQFDATRTDKYGFTRQFKVYESENCSDCPLRSLCTKAKEDNQRRIYHNEHWEEQKNIFVNYYQKKQLEKFMKNER